LIARVRSGIVRIESTLCTETVLGTGFLLDTHDVATVDHVVDGATAITLSQNNKVVGTGTVIGADPSRDLALVHTSFSLEGYHFTISPRAPQLAEAVATLGFPLGLPLTVTQGVVSGSDRTIPINGIDRQKLVQTDAAVNPGNSGGPLIATDTGEVVGLVDLGTSQANGLAFAVSGLVAAPLLQAWKVGPQPIATPSCGSSAPPPVAAPAPPPTPPPPPPQLTTFTGSIFSIDYPNGWITDTNELQKPGYVDTTIRDPSDPEHTYLRVNYTPNVHASLYAAANGQHQNHPPGYRELGFDSTTLDGQPAIRWEFEGYQTGSDGRAVFVHKIDIFMIDSQHTGWAILTQAPASNYYSWLPTFQQTFNSFAVTH